ARVILVEVLVRLEYQVVLRITHPRIANQLGVELLPEEGVREAVAGNHDPLRRIDGTNRFSSFKGSRWPQAVASVIGLVHQTVAVERRVLRHFLCQTTPGGGELSAWNLRRVDELAVVAVVVVHIKDDLDAMLTGEIKGLLDARQF